MERRKVPFTTMIEWSQLEALEKLANSRGTSIAAIIREALDQYLSEKEESEK
jgi:predicted DNA-binding protein